MKGLVNHILANIEEIENEIYVDLLREKCLKSEICEKCSIFVPSIRFSTKNNY